MLTVHVRISDAASNRPTPVRLRLLDADGVVRMPFGRSATFATGAGEAVGGHLLLGEAAYAYIDGVCEVHLSPGRVHVEVHKGPEYEPIVRDVVLGPGKIALRLTVERALDWRSRGWYCGDGRAHALSPHAARLEGAAEGLDVVNLLATNCVDLLAFSGTQPALEGPPCVVVNTLNAHPVLGEAALLNCHRVVHPLRFGAPDGSDDWSVVDWCDQCHRKKGLVVLPSPPRGEALAALILGKIDAFEICRLGDPLCNPFADWYRLLACGLRLPLMGASGKDRNTVALGCVRTYARLEPNQEFGYGAWIEAVRAGRTFLTDGPLLDLTVNGCDPGAVLSLPDERQSVRGAVEGRSVTPFDCLEVLHNGAVVATRDTSGDRRSALLEAEIPVSQSGWVAARCRSGETVRAHTSPVYVEVEGRPARANAETLAPLLASLEQTLAWVRNEARCGSERQREQLAETLRAARQELTRRGA
jgi:hypothetical protein